MTTLTQPSYNVLSGLTIKDGITVEDVMNSTEVGQFSVLHAMEEGLERLKNVLLDPGKLKIDIKGSPVTVLEGTTYYIGSVQLGRIFNQRTWELTAESDFDDLKQALEKDMYLFSKIPEGFVVIASKDNLVDMKVTRDMRGYWHDLVAEYFNNIIQDMAPWEVRGKFKPYSRYIDIAGSFALTDEEDSERINNETFLVETLDDLLEDVVSQVISFFRKDTLNLTIAIGNARGVQITRHGNALALKFAMMKEYERLEQSSDEQVE